MRRQYVIVLTVDTSRMVATEKLDEAVQAVVRNCTAQEAIETGLFVAGQDSRPRYNVRFASLSIAQPVEWR